MIYLLDLNVLGIVEEMLRNFAAIVPNLLGALAVLIIGYLISRILAKLLRRVLRTIGADRLAEKINQIDFVRKSKIQLVPSVVLSKIIYYFLLFLFIAGAIDVLGMPAISGLMNDFLNYIPYLLSALLVFVAGILLADFLRGIVHSACKSLGIPAGNLIANFIFYFIFLNVVMITLEQAQINTNFIQDNISIILAGIVLAFALGYGYASRPLVANLLSSYYNKNRVRVGDFISLDGISGEIIAKDNTSLTVQSDNDKTIIVPFGKLASEHYELKRKKE